VRPATLRLARILGFRYDRGRHAYVLRLIGGRFGPVLRTTPPVDSAAAAIEWPAEMQEREQRRQAERRTTGRFTREEQRTEAERRESLRH
jgi:hypothetical protein